MRVPVRVFVPVVVASFVLGILAFRGLGVWKDRERSLPAHEIRSPAPPAPAPGKLPM